MGEFRMPALGADMDEGTLVEWLVKPGDPVHRGEIIAVVDTAKTAMEIEAFETGVIERLLVEPGTTVPVGAPLALITSEVGAAPTPGVAPPAPPAVPAPGVASPIVRHLAHALEVDLAGLTGTGDGGVITRSDVEQAAHDRGAREPLTAPAASTAPIAVPIAVPTPRAGGRIAASPLARRRAAESGIDLATVHGTGPGGAISEADVRRAATTPAAPAATADAVTADAVTQRAAAMRRAIGNLMARSKREIPHYYLTATIDMTAATTWLQERNAQRPVAERLVPAVLMLKASALAARKVPDLNGFWIDDRFVAGDGVHLGVAVSLRQGGLIAPAIRDADQLDVDTLMGRLRDLVARARAGRLRQSEMTDPTITVTNLGDLGVDSVHGVIYPPQVALVGFGRVAERPWAHDGMLGVRDVVVATLSADHRASDGHRGGRFLAVIDDLLQKPEEL
jgi:pyruvate dehydrogenase E2 component (dihydrolipoamide acetyltransferase)